MLVLSRKRNESIVINDNIKITVVDIRGDKVRLGITAPRDIPVHREEVYEAIYGKPVEIPGRKEEQPQPAEAASSEAGPEAQADSDQTASDDSPDN